MRYKVVLSKNEDGYTVHCPGLRGCWSQGRHRTRGPGEHPQRDRGIPGRRQRIGCRRGGPRGGGGCWLTFLHCRTCGLCGLWSGLAFVCFAKANMW